MPPLPEASGTLTLQAEVPSGLVEGAREAPVEGHLLAIPQDHLVQRADYMGSFIHGLQDQFPWEGAQLEERRSWVMGEPGQCPCSGSGRDAFK